LGCGLARAALELHVRAHRLARAVRERVEAREVRITGDRALRDGVRVGLGRLRFLADRLLALHRILRGVALLCGVRELVREQRVAGERALLRRVGTHDHVVADRERDRAVLGGHRAGLGPAVDPGIARTNPAAALWST